MKISIAQLSLDPKNARKHSARNLEAIAASLLKFGQRKPLVVHRGVVLAGNGTLEAARSLGWTEIEVSEVPLDWDNDTAKAYALADNRTAELAEWDESELAKQLLELQDADWNIEELGFEVPALSDIDGDKDEDEIPEPPVEPKTKLGDIYQLGRHRLMCGDATSFGDVSDLLNGVVADCAVTDPPYGIDVVKGGKVGADFGIAKKGNYSAVINDDTTNTAKQNYEIIKELSSKQVIWGGNYFTDFLPFSDGWIVWDKRGDSGIRNTFADGEMAWCSFHTPIRIYTQLWNGMIREGEHEKRVHPTQKPIKMLGSVVKDFTKPEGIVLDCFGGSGSVLIACDATDRTCYMMELDPKYCDVIIKRWENLTGLKAELISK